MSRAEAERAPTVRLAHGGRVPLAEREAPGARGQGGGRLTPILVLDLGSETGWALRWNAGHMASGVESFQTRRSESSGARMLRFRTWLREMLSLSEAALVAYEQPAVHGEPGRRNVSVAHNLEGVLLAELEGRHDYVAATSVEVKRHATGRGNASRAQVAAAVLARWGKQVEDEHEASALCLLAWALDVIGEPVPGVPSAPVVGP